MQDGFATILDIPLQPVIGAAILIADTALGFVTALATLNLIPAIFIAIMACMIPVVCALSVVLHATIAITRTGASIVDLASKSYESTESYCNP